MNVILPNHKTVHAKSFNTAPTEILSSLPLQKESGSGDPAERQEDLLDKALISTDRSITIFDGFIHTIQNK